MPVIESVDNSTLISERLVNNLAHAKSRRREPVGVEMVRDLRLRENNCFKPSAGRGTCCSFSCINSGLAEFLKKFCNEVHVSVAHIWPLASEMLQRLNLVSCGDAVIAVAICSLQ